MKPPILLVHPVRYEQLCGKVFSKSTPPLPDIDYRQLAGVEVRQSPYVPLTTSVKQRRAWWAFWRPKFSVVEKSILGWWFTERGGGKILEALPSRETEE